MNMNAIVITALVLAVTSSPVIARGGSGGGGHGGHSHSSDSYSPGTGSTSNSTYVRGHTTKNGTYVEGHRASKPDNNFNNNWTTKGNENPYTGKDGTRVSPANNN